MPAVTRFRINESNSRPEPPTIHYAFQQQSLNAKQPILTAETVIPFFFVVGIIFIPVGIGLYRLSENAQEITIPYTHCVQEDDGLGGRNESKLNCSEVIRKNSTKNGYAPITSCTCKINFTLSSNFQGKVFMYYALDHYYQNHRRYVKSRDDNQLLGIIGTAEKPIKPSEECFPFDVVGEGKYVFPCGAIANSLFSDEIEVYKYNPSSGDEEKVELNRTGIAWSSDKKYKFKNPPEFSNRNHTIWTKFTKPKAWKKSLWELDLDNPDNNGLQNEDLIVWMRTEALPNFRKLYRIWDSSPNANHGGEYVLKVNYLYDVESFRGSKSIVFATTSLIGGKNNFLGISYITVGTLSILCGLGMLYTHLSFRRSIYQLINVSSRTRYIDDY